MTRQLTPLAAGRQKQQRAARAVARRASAAEPARAPTGSVLALQRAIGNHAVTRLVQGPRTAGTAPLMIQRNPATDLIRDHSPFGVLDKRALAKVLLGRAAQGDHAFVHEVLNELEPTARADVAATMALSVNGPIEKILKKSEEGRRLLARIVNGEEPPSVGSARQATAPLPPPGTAQSSTAAAPPQNQTVAPPGRSGRPAAGPVISTASPNLSRPTPDLSQPAPARPLPVGGSTAADAAQPPSYASRATSEHVHEGDTDRNPRSPYYGKWNGAGIHSYEALKARCNKDDYDIEEIKQDPATGARQVTVKRFGRDPNTRNEVSETIVKTVYPKKMSQAEIDAAGEQALQLALHKGPDIGFVVTSRKPDGTVDRAKFQASVPGPDGQMIRIEGWFTEDTPGRYRIVSHWPISRDDWPVTFQRQSEKK